MSKKGHDWSRDLRQDKINMLQASFQAVLEQEDLFSKIIDFFPYPIQVYGRDGTTVMVNRAMLQELEISGKDMVIGKYNIFKDPEREKSALLELVEEVFDGKTHAVTDIKMPVKSIRQAYQMENPNIYSMYQDVTVFPIPDEKGEVSHVAVLLITKRIYKGKINIARAIEYLENNWDKKYNLNEAAKAAGLSPCHFSRVFKSDVGVTPHTYYIKLKMEHLMEKLRDTNLTVKEAFYACGLEYTGYYFGVFKKHTGVTPLQYREITIK